MDPCCGQIHWLFHLAMTKELGTRRAVRDNRHLKWLAAAQAIFAALIAWALYWNLCLLNQVSGDTARFHEDSEFQMILNRIFLTRAIVGFVLSIVMVLNGLAGICLLRRKARVFCMTVGAIDCLFIPFGTVLGVFSFAVLARSSVRTLFESTSVTSAPHTPYSRPVQR